MLVYADHAAADCGIPKAAPPRVTVLLTFRCFTTRIFVKVGWDKPAPTFSKPSFAILHS